MPSGPRPLRATGVGHGDVDARPVVVVVRQRVVLHLAIQVVADLEGPASVGAHGQHEAAARSFEGRKVDDVNAFARRRIEPGGLGFAVRRLVAIGGHQFPVELLFGIRAQRRDLGQIWVIADLVDQDINRTLGLLFGRASELLIFKPDVVDTNRQRRVGSVGQPSAHMKGELGARIVLSALAKLSRKPSRSRVELNLVKPIFGVGRPLHADFGTNVRWLRSEGAKADRVAMAALDHHLAMANLGVPVVVAAIVDA